MDYSTLHLQDFRSYHDQTVQFDPGVNIVVGPNGSGKTNLLEALYVLSQGSSYRVADRDLIEYNQPWLRLEGLYGDQHRAVVINADSKPTKQFSLDKVKRQRLAAAQRVPLVLFEPEELRVLNGSPTRRRDYMDGLLERLWPLAGLVRGRYARALLQRNNVLKNGPHGDMRALNDQLFVWNIKLAEYAASLVEYRLRLIDTWNQRLSGVYSDIAQKDHRLRVEYRCDIPLDNYKSNLLERLTRSVDYDFMRGFTGVGPHRDDFGITLNGADVAVSASRGESRSLMLALKLVELKQLETICPNPPLLLLDDVFSELDAARRKALARLARDHQTLITTTDADAIARHFLGGFKIIQTDKKV